MDRYSAEPIFTVMTRDRQKMSVWPDGRISGFPSEYSIVFNRIPTMIYIPVKIQKACKTSDPAIWRQIIAARAHEIMCMTQGDASIDDIADCSRELTEFINQVDGWISERSGVHV